MADSSSSKSSRKSDEIPASKGAALGTSTAGPHPQQKQRTASRLAALSSKQKKRKGLPFGEEDEDDSQQHPTEMEAISSKPTTATGSNTSSSSGVRYVSKQLRQEATSTSTASGVTPDEGDHFQRLRAEKLAETFGRNIQQQPPTAPTATSVSAVGGTRAPLVPHHTDGGKKEASKSLGAYKSTQVVRLLQGKKRTRGECNAETRNVLVNALFEVQDHQGGEPQGEAGEEDGGAGGSAVPEDKKRQRLEPGKTPSPPPC